MHAGKVGLVVLGLFLFVPLYAQAFQFQDVVEKAKSKASAAYEPVPATEPSILTAASVSHT